MSQRVWQAISILLGLVLVVVGAAAATVFLQRTANHTPRPTATATARPTPTPSPIASASASPTESSTESPAETDLPTLEPSPSDGASGQPSASPTDGTTGSLTTVAFSVENIGLDDPGRQGALSRFLTFFSDGAGDVRAAIDGTIGGRVRLCLYRGSPSEMRSDPLCFDGKKGFVRGVAAGPGRIEWTVLVSNPDAGARPATDVTITYRTRQPRVDLTDFHFMGTGDQPRNGFRAHIKARTGGKLSVTANWLVNDAGQPYDYRVRVRDLTDGSELSNETGTGTGVEASGSLKADHEYQVDVRDVATAAGADVRLDATVGWP